MKDEELSRLIAKEVDKELLELQKMLLSYSNLTKENMDAFSINLQKNIKLGSKFLVQDICKTCNKKILTSSFFNNVKIKNKFYKEDISEKVKEVFLEVEFLKNVDSLNLNQINKTYTSLAATAGTATVGGIIKYVLQNKIDVPILTILIGSLIVGGVTFLSVVPAINKSRQQKAIDEFFTELKAAWLDWLKEVEAYYLQEVENFKANLKLLEV